MAEAPIIIVPYDPQWPLLYEEEKTRILGAIGHKTIAIEHIGSIAVPGLGAKPIIDLMVAIESLTEVENCIAPLQGIGYEYVAESDLPERRHFRKGAATEWTHHLSLVGSEGDFWHEHLMFRDHLREHSEMARKYFQLKNELATKLASDRHSYTSSKAAFIESVIATASVGR